MEQKHFIADIDEMIAGLEARRQRNIEAVKAMGRELTPAEDARFEVGWGMLTDMITDLTKLRDGWRDGHPMYRKTEKMLEATE